MSSRMMMAMVASRYGEDGEATEDAVPLMRAADGMHTDARHTPNSGCEPDDSDQVRARHHHPSASTSSSASTLVVSSQAVLRLSNDDEDIEDEGDDSDDSEGVGHVPYKSYKPRRNAGLRNDEFHTRLRKRTPLPLFQLFILCLTRLSEPIAYTQIFPYVNKMVEDMKVTTRRQEIGYYSGVVDSIFAVCQLFTVLQWGKLSDRIGRKPVILAGLAGVAVSTLLFGLARSFWAAVLARSLAGALSGNSAIMQSAVAELTDETNQALAFPLTGLSWSVGCIAGPMIGGNFVNPEKTFPTSFGRLAIFRANPYFLPCVITAVIVAVSIAIGIFFLKETLPSKVRLDPSLPSPISSSSSSSHHDYDEKRYPPLPSPSSLSDSNNSTEKTEAEKEREKSVRFILASRSIRSVFRNYFLLSTLGTAFDVVFILLSYTPVYLGGLSRTPDEIGYALAFSGVAGSVIQVFVFPILQRKFDNIPLYRALMLLWPILFAILPFLNILARWSAPSEILALASAPVNAVVGAVADVMEGGDLGQNLTASVNATAMGLDVDLGGGMEAPAVTYPAGPLLWTGIGLALAVFRCASMCYSLNTILIKNAAPSDEALGATFGLAQTVACVARAGAPAFVSTLFAMSKRYGMLGGNMVWVVMFGVAVCGWWSTLYIVDGKDNEVGSRGGVLGVGTGSGAGMRMVRRPRGSRTKKSGGEACEMREL